MRNSNSCRIPVLRGVLIASLAFAAAACDKREGGQGTETGNGLVATLSMALESSEGGAELTGNDAQSTSLAVDAARAYVDRIDFHLADGDACTGFAAGSTSLTVTCAESMLRIAGPIVVDLAAGTSTPSLAGINVPQAMYSRVDVVFKAGRAADGLIAADDPLDGRSFAGSGTFAYQGAQTGFDIRLRPSLNIKFERAEAIDLSAGESQDILLLLDVAQWFSDLPLTNCLDQGQLELVDGRLNVEDGRGACTRVEVALARNIRNSGRLDRKP